MNLLFKFLYAKPLKIHVPERGLKRVKKTYMFSIKTVKIDKTNEEAIMNRAIAKKRLKRNCNKYIYYINILVTCSGNLVSYSIVKKCVYM